ncbi:MAG: hypothetical protein IJE05_03800 [Clostridia bacterium]|nr:hypothetical protein [Clostridia bacterium]
MDTFADYILAEKNLASKMEIVYYLSKKENIFFDKSVVLKTELARLFLRYSKLELDENLVLTACLLCNCKKIENLKKIEDIKTYAKDGADYLERLGFDKRFCKICEEVNRYSGSSLREKESDVLELVEQFGGMILDRPERIGFKPDEALVLLIHSNLKNQNNRYIEIFSQFIDMLEEINMGEFVEVKALKRLTKIFNETEELTDFIKKIVNNYEVQIDNLIAKKYKEIKNEMFEEERNKRPLFTEETTKKIIGNIEKQKQIITNQEVV